MKKIMAPIMDACKRYNLIEEGDKICVGLSGGKDSLIMLEALKLLQRKIKGCGWCTSLTAAPAVHEMRVLPLQKGITSAFATVMIMWSRICMKISCRFSENTRMPKSPRL